MQRSLQIKLLFEVALLSVLYGQGPAHAVSYGADLNALNNYGATLTDIATYYPPNRYGEKMRALHKLGLDVDRNV